MNENELFELKDNLELVRSKLLVTNLFNKKYRAEALEFAIEKIDKCLKILNSDE